MISVDRKDRNSDIDIGILVVDMIERSAVQSVTNSKEI